MKSRGGGGERRYTGGGVALEMGGDGSGGSLGSAQKAETR